MKMEAITRWWIAFCQTLWFIYLFIFFRRLSEWSMHKIQLCIQNWGVKKKIILKQAAMQTQCCVILFNSVLHVGTPWSLSWLYAVVLMNLMRPDWTMEILLLLRALSAFSFFFLSVAYTVVMNEPSLLIKSTCFIMQLWTFPYSITSLIISLTSPLGIWRESAHLGIVTFNPAK